MKAVNVSLDMRAIPVVLALCLGAAVASVASAQNEPHVGTWELNLARSTFSPDPAPKKQTLTFHAAGPQWVALLQGPLAVTVCFHNALEPKPRKQMAQTAENVVRRGLAEALHGKAKIR